MASTDSLRQRRTQQRVFGQMFSKKGVAVRSARLESPEQNGRAERRGGTLKHTMTKSTRDTHAAGKDTVDMMLTERLNAAQKR